MLIFPVSNPFAGNEEFINYFLASEFLAVIWFAGSTALLEVLLLSLTLLLSFHFGLAPLLHLCGLLVLGLFFAKVWLFFPNVISVEKVSAAFGVRLRSLPPRLHTFSSFAREEHGLGLHANLLEILRGVGTHKDISIVADLIQSLNIFDCTKILNLSDSLFLGVSSVPLIVDYKHFVFQTGARGKVVLLQLLDDSRVLALNGL